MVNIPVVRILITRLASPLLVQLSSSTCIRRLTIKIKPTRCQLVRGRSPSRAEWHSMIWMSGCLHRWRVMVSALETSSTRIPPQIFNQVRLMELTTRSGCGLEGIFSFLFVSFLPFLPCLYADQERVTSCAEFYSFPISAALLAPRYYVTFSSASDLIAKSLRPLQRHFLPALLYLS